MTSKPSESCDNVSVTLRITGRGTEVSDVEEMLQSVKAEREKIYFDFENDICQVFKVSPIHASDCCEICDVEVQNNGGSE